MPLAENEEFQRILSGTFNQFLKPGFRLNYFSHCTNTCYIFTLNFWDYEKHHYFGLEIAYIYKAKSLKITISDF